MREDGIAAPIGSRRAGFSVALVGPDGAGKTTIARLLTDDPHLSIKYLYMGPSASATGSVLPTTKLLRTLRRRWHSSRREGAVGVATADGRPSTLRRRFFRSGAGLAARVEGVSEEWYRNGLRWWHRRRGFIVLLDRDLLIDYVAYGKHRSEGRLFRPLHSFLLRHVYPRPDLVIYLEAPAGTLLQRKGEGTLRSLERDNAAYRDALRLARHRAIINGSRSVLDVVRDVRDEIEAFGRRPQTGAGV